MVIERILAVNGHGDLLEGAAAGRNVLAAGAVEDPLDARRVVPACEPGGKKRLRDVRRKAYAKSRSWCPVPALSTSPQGAVKLPGA
jgi:hypothetical protein